MKGRSLKKALMAGTVALIWSIPSCNIFAVIAVILGWVTNSVTSRSSASASVIFYTIAALWAGVELLLARRADEIFAMLGLSVSEGTSLESLLGFITAASAVFIVVYIICAFFCFKGANEIDDDSDRQFFD